jgi:hypothetical protein
MKKAIVFAALAALAASVTYAALGEVLASWQAPVSYRDTINGVACEGVYIWLKDEYSNYGNVYKCTTAGSVIREISFPYRPTTYSYGLTFDGEYLWTIYRDTHHGPKCDNYEKYTTTGSHAGGFGVNPYSFTTQGLTWDSGYIYTDRWWPRPPHVEKYTTSGTLVATFRITIDVDDDMAYYKRQLWYCSDHIVFGVTLNGSIVGSFNAPGGWASSTAFDGQYLWTIDRNEPQWVYKVDIDVVDVAPASVGRVKALYR